MARKGWKIASHREPYEFVFRLQRILDGTFRWHLARVNPRIAGKKIAEWVGTATDIHDQKMAQEELRQSSQVLEKRVKERTAQLAEMNQELESFSYSVSHDLKAPLRTIRGFAQVLIEEFSSEMDKTAQLYLQRIVASGEKMDELISALLSYSRVGRSELVLEPVDLKKGIEDALSQMSDDLEKTRATIEVGKDWPLVTANRVLFEQAISNLVSNAIKYVRPGSLPEIWISSERRENGRLRILIRDHGIGIEPENHRRIFKPFNRLHGNSEYSGSGIGLAIVQKATERMHGEVGVESELGKGSTFWIELPLWQP
jgi:signal transduction histidine kinase